jgi:hypothetical protein
MGEPNRRSWAAAAALVAGTLVLPACNDDDVAPLPAGSDAGAGTTTFAGGAAGAASLGGSAGTGQGGASDAAAGAAPFSGAGSTACDSCGGICR